MNETVSHGEAEGRASRVPEMKPAASWATTVGVVFLILTQFGLIGSSAEKEKLKEAEKFHQLQMELKDIKNSVEGLSARFDAAAGDEWTRQEMEVWVSEMKARHPEIEWVAPVSVVRR